MKIWVSSYFVYLCLLSAIKIEAWFLSSDASDIRSHQVVGCNPEVSSISPETSDIRSHQVVGCNPEASSISSDLSGSSFEGFSVSPDGSIRSSDFSGSIRSF